MHDSRYNYVKKKFDDKANYYSQTQTRWHMKLKLKMFIKSFGMIRINLTIATILIILHIYFDKLSLCYFDDKRYIHMTYYGILQNTKLKQEKQWFYTKAVGK